MSRFYTLFHIAGGSTVEAAHAEYVAGPFPDESTAEQFGDDVYQLVTGRNPNVLGPPTLDYLTNNLFSTVIEIPTTLATKEEVTAFLKKYDDEEDE